MRIQELERMTGADRATIRFYEKQGLISPSRSENGYRDYSKEDAEELKRILLLRELGLTIDTIRGLQQGREDFPEVMNRQARILTNRSDRMAQASTVCKVLGSEGIGYTQLETEKYHAMLNAPPQLPSAAKSETSVRFSERVEKEIHPWRRFFARMIDHSIVNVLLFFFVVVVLRIRPVSEGMQVLTGIGAWFLLVPEESALLHFFGTTPGKWIMGIRIEHYCGCRLTFNAAFSRTIHAVMFGVAFGVPILTDVCMLWQYCKLTGRSYRRFRRYDDVQAPVDMEWDDYTEIFYPTGMSWKRLSSLIVAAAICVFATFFTAMDSVLPKFRGNDITISQFSANYNMYNDILYSNMATSMLSDGMLYDDGAYTTIVVDGIKEVPYEPTGAFQYETEGERVTAITMHHNWYEHAVFWDYSEFMYGSLPEDAAGRWMNTDCKIALIAVVAAQDGMNAKKIDEFREILEEKLKLPASNSVIWNYENVTITWKIDAERYQLSEDNNSAIYNVTLDLRIDIA